MFTVGNFLAVFLISCSVVSCYAVSGLTPTNGFHMGIKGVKAASMSCEYTLVNTTENVTVQWFKNDLNLLNVANYFINTSVPGVSNLTVLVVGSNDVGPLYTCVHQPSGDIREVILFAVPVVSIERHGEKSRTVVEGHDVELNCTAWGWPIPNITWTHEHNLDLTNLQNVTAYGNVSLSVGLNVKNLNMSDRGDFVCTASNVFNGTDHAKSDSILVRVKDNLAPLWPFLGILAEIIVLAVIIGVYEVRKSKQKRLEAQKEANEHTTLATRSNDDASDVRQRK